MSTTVVDTDRPMQRIGLHRKHWQDLVRRVEKYTRKRNWHRRNKAVRKLMEGVA